MNYDQLSLQRKVAQCIMPRISEHYWTNSQEYRLKIKRLVREVGVGGFCVFQGDLLRTASMIQQLQAISEVPLLFSGDFEFGLPMRLSGNSTVFPHALAIGQNQSPFVAYEIAQAIAREMRLVGIHWNFAPVCDVNSNPLNPVINIRAYGNTPQKVEQFTEQVIKGLQDNFILACAKHFPGHGDTSQDSHHVLAKVLKDIDQLTDIELAPFRHAISTNVQSVMIGHIDVPAFEERRIPATLSRPIIEGLLRNKLQYNGLVVTDAMEMKAITSNYSNYDSSVMAFQAGNDIILLPTDPEESIQAIIHAIEKRGISEDRLHQSLDRIFEAKRWSGCFDKSVNSNVQNSSKIGELPDLNEHRRLALRVAFEAITVNNTHSKEFLLADKNATLSEDDVTLEVVPKTTFQPIKDNTSCAVFAFTQDTNNGELGVYIPSEVDLATSFFRHIAQLHEGDCHFGFLNHSITNDELERLALDLYDVETCIFVFFKSTSLASVRPPRTQEAVYRAIELLGKYRTTISVLFTNPSLSEALPTDYKVQTFSYTEPTLAATALFLKGKGIDEFINIA